MAAAAAVEEKSDLDYLDYLKFDFDPNRTPDVSCITVPACKVLISRLSKLVFKITLLDDTELISMMNEISLLLPYHRAIVEELLVQRINAESALLFKSLAIWERFCNLEDKNTIAFYAKYYDPKKIFAKGDWKSEDLLAHFGRSYSLGERYHSPFALAGGSSFLELSDSKEYIDCHNRIKLMEEACLAGNLDAYDIVSSHLLKSKENYDKLLNLFSKNVFLGPRFSGIDNQREFAESNYLKHHEFKEFDTALTAKKVLGYAIKTYNDVEFQIAHNRIDRHYYIYSKPTWVKKEFHDHVTFLQNILSKIIRQFNEEGLKMITDYFSVFPNTAGILFSLGTLLDDETEAFNLIIKAARLRDYLAYRYLTTHDLQPNTRQKRMYDQFHSLFITSLK
ncbi:MAG: hypothetical protein Harvfovirus25_6 [Harvfovirus sp.]|uniref:Uncharacterized protein n=1 Tax=Harvfovirus sp. TaxID=2487768 RepID=A0A3G5A234_9VIRU|nr:MAG: hypothetical protein Harvfovirus25_6 [Harvfovirus sp.]